MSNYEIIIYQDDDIRLNLRLSTVERTVWLSIDDLTRLFSKERSLLAKQIKKMRTDSVCAKNAQAEVKIPTIASDGKTYDVTYFNLEFIIELGHRIRSDRALKLKRFVDNYFDNKHALKPLNDEEIIIYNNGFKKIEVKFSLKEETFFITQDMMAELFETSQQNISLHIKNILLDGELDENSVHKDSLYAAPDGKSYWVSFYNLDMILAVGYRVKSKRAIEFRKWASQVLKNYLISGYSINPNSFMNIIELKQDVDDLEKRVKKIESNIFVEPIKEKIFFVGQEYDAYIFLWNILSQAKQKVSVIDRYFDSSSLKIFYKLDKNIVKEVYLSNPNNIDANELSLFREQYGSLNIKTNNLFHDRFIIIDEKECYSIGTSINGMKKRIFLISKIETQEIIKTITGIL